MTATEMVICYSVLRGKGLPCRSHGGEAPGVSGGQGKGKHGQEPLLWFPWELDGKAG